VTGRAALADGQDQGKRRGGAALPAEADEEETGRVALAVEREEGERRGCARRCSEGRGGAGRRCQEMATGGAHR
jgi:hypothetical protein